MGLRRRIIDMRRLIARIARACGWKTDYYITYTWSTNTGNVTCSELITVKPWLRSGDMEELKGIMTKTALANGSSKTPNLIFIVKLGA